MISLHTARSLFGAPKVTVPDGLHGFLIRDGLACDVMTGGPHALISGDQVIFFPKGIIEGDVALGPQRWQVAIEVLTATYNGSDFFAHFFAGLDRTTLTAEEIVTPFLKSALAAGGSVEEVARVVRKELRNVGFDLIDLNPAATLLAEADEQSVGGAPGSAEAETAPDDSSVADSSGPAPSSDLLSQIAEADISVEETDEAIIERVLVRLGEKPSLGRKWWRGESFATFDQRLVERALIVTGVIISVLEAARRDRGADRREVERVRLRATGLRDRLEAHTSRVIRGSFDRKALATESERILTIAEQVEAVAPSWKEHGFQAVHDGLEELRRAVDRRTELLST